MEKKIVHSVRLEGAVPGGRRVYLDFRWGGERLPGILLLPESSARVPAAILLHGYSLDKERMSGTVGQALLDNGVASLTLDLPLHGERFEKLDTSTMRTPFELMRRWRAALDESAVALEYLEQHPQIGRLGLVGYSLGAYVGLKVAAAHDSVRSIVLAAAGDLPDYIPFAKVARMLVDPIKSVVRLSGRPVLMMHGKWDRTISPEQAQRLFDAAPGPKEIRWWDSGHILPPAAIDFAAQWMAASLTAVPVF